MGFLLLISNPCFRISQWIPSKTKISTTIYVLSAEKGRRNADVKDPTYNHFCICSDLGHSEGCI